MRDLRKFHGHRNGNLFTRVEGNTIYVMEDIKVKKWFKEVQDTKIVSFFVAVNASEISIEEWLAGFNLHQRSVKHEDKN